MRRYALFFIFTLQLSWASISNSDTDNHGYREAESGLNTLSPFDFEFHSVSPLGFFFRLGDDFTYRRYGDYLSLNGLRTLPTLAFNAMIYWMVSKTTASVLSRWTENPLMLHTAQVLSMAILPGVKSALYTWYTGTRLGSEQIQVDPPHIRKRFYLELIYQQQSHQQTLRITPFPLNPSISPWLAETPLPEGYSPWLELYEASSQHGVVHIDLSWVSPMAANAIRIDIDYSDKSRESTLVTLTNTGNSESLPVSIESLLHNEAKDFANGFSIASLLSDAVIKNTIALIQNPDSASTSLPVSQVAGNVEFEADGHSGQLSLCGEQQPECNSHLQLTYKLFPYPHFGMTLQGQQDIKTSVDATIKQLANANRAELILQLLEKAVLHFFIASFQQNNQEPENTGKPYFQASSQHNERSLKTIITPPHDKLAKALQPVVKTLMPEGGIWKSGKLSDVPPVLWVLHPALFRSFMVKPEVSSSEPLKRFKASPGVNTALLTGKQVELIQKVLDGKASEITEDEFVNVIDYFTIINSRQYVPDAYLESPSLMKDFVRNGILCADEIPVDKLTKDILLAQSDGIHTLTRYDKLPDELKKDLDFLIEFSGRYGIPYSTPAKLAIFIYCHLDTVEKTGSLHRLPASFKSEYLYDELIRSGMIEVDDLPERIKNKNKAFCLSQLANGFCELSDVPIHFMTKESILSSINNGKHLSRNFRRICSDEYKMFTSDPVFYEELLVKVVTVELEMLDKFDSELYSYSNNSCLCEVHNSALKRYEADGEKFGLLLKKLTKANPFILLYTVNLDDALLQELIGIAKESLLDILSRRPKVSHGLYPGLIEDFFETVNADESFKVRVLNIVYPYVLAHIGEAFKPRTRFPEQILKEQDKMVLKSRPFHKGKEHLLFRKLRPVDRSIVVEYIERHREFVYFFKDKEYLESCCTDPILRQRLIYTFAQRLVANKHDLLHDFKDNLPRQLLDDTLDFLKDPALFFKLDSSEKLTEPVNPLEFQLPNTSAFELLVALHAFGVHFADQDSTRQLKSEFVRAAETEFQPVYPGQHPITLFEKEGTIVGGRTLAIANGEEVDYYKFHRVGELKTALAKEGIMHQFAAKSDRFKSQKPRFGQYLLVLEKDLPKGTEGFTDCLQASDFDGKRACLVYHFKATNNFAKYAHTPDVTGTPYATAEQGLLKGIHDIGVLNGQFGIMPKSSLPSYHASQRPWVFLSPLLDESLYSVFPLPREFTGWIEAIERPEFGWNGLRDWGNMESYGAVKSGLTNRDLKTTDYSPEVLQRLSFANAICEKLLSAVLLRSRLRRNSPDYHYQNLQAVKETENFIEQLLNEYLSGLFAKEKELQPKSRLQKLMRLDDAKYRSWLTRTAQEILYWTALQPDEVTDPCAFTPSGECYSEHLKRSGRLDKTLYPKHLHPLDEHKKFPRDFRLATGQSILGARRSVFPLISLVKGLTLFVSNIFAYEDQYTEGADWE
ncbi:hypothetical protein [Endozoicomonas sp. 2B-B]